MNVIAGTSNPWGPALKGLMVAKDKASKKKAGYQLYQKRNKDIINEEYKRQILTGVKVGIALRNIIAKELFNKLDLEERAQYEANTMKEKEDAKKRQDELTREEPRLTKDEQKEYIPISSKILACTNLTSI
jgi:hypothetical protein